MDRVLVVIDVQNDFITGSLGSDSAVLALSNVIKKVNNYDINNIYATMDTHDLNYLDTLEGENLPVLHCVKGSYGWCFPSSLGDFVFQDNVFEKSSFASFQLAEKLFLRNQVENIEIEVVGVCTDICVVSNVLMLRSKMPNVNIYVDSSCCAGTSVSAHLAALEVMRMCQVVVL